MKDEISFTIFFISNTEDSDKSSSFGVKLTIKKSFEPYFSEFYLKSFKSGSFSKRRVSEEAYSLKFEMPVPRRRARKNNKSKFFFGLEEIKLIKVIIYFLISSDYVDQRTFLYLYLFFH